MEKALCHLPPIISCKKKILVLISISTTASVKLSAAGESRSYLSPHIQHTLHLSTKTIMMFHTPKQRMKTSPFLTSLY